MGSLMSGLPEIETSKSKLIYLNTFFERRQKIAFVDYTSEESAKTAMSSTRQFRFPGSSKGITVRYSDNSKNKQTGEIINRNNQSDRRDR